MFMPDIKLIASDLDGTLLLDGAQDLSEDTCGLIREVCAKRGIIFFAASGRQYYSLKRLFAPIRDEIGYICENGCVNYAPIVWTRNEMLYAYLTYGTLLV